MKFRQQHIAVIDQASRPARGGWIEIFWQIILFLIGASRPARGGWIEIWKVSKRRPYWASRPARGGWIEIYTCGYKSNASGVPPRTGRVD